MRYLLASILCLCFSQAGYAQSKADIFDLQVRLAQDGFYKAEIDGLQGPAMRRALRAFSEKYGGEPTVAGVLDKLVTRVAPSERRPVTEDELRLGREHVREYLRDGESARFKDEYAFGGESVVAICGRVNAKNAYGAYGGYQTFQVTLSILKLGSSDLVSPTGNPLSPDPSNLCSIGASVLGALKTKE